MPVLLVCATVLTTACGLWMNEEALLARAQKERAAGDLRAASLDLKNLLRKNPANVEARVSLGEITLQQGDVIAATQELEAARKAGASADRVTAPLARAYLGRQRAEDALKLASDAPPGAHDAELNVVKGMALLQLDRASDAREEFELALKSDTKDVEALIGLAITTAKLDGVPAGLEVTDRALEAAPKDPRVRNLRGEFQLRAQAPELALKEFEQAERDAESLKQGEQRFSAQAGQAETLLSQSNVEGSLAVTARMQQIRPEHPITRYMRARALILAGKPTEAQPLLEKNVSVDALTNESKLLLGAIALNGGLLGQAEMYLNTVATAQPNNLRARELLAEARMRQSKPEDAVNALLQPSGDSAEPNAKMLAAAGKVSFASGQTAAGLDYLERSVKADPESSAARLELVAALLLNGQTERAVAQLNNVPAEAVDTPKYRYLKALTFIAKGDKAGAVNFATSLAAKESSNADAQMLAGSLLASQKDFAKARSYFERAATLQPTSPAPYVNLGRLELAQGHADAAREQFTKAMKQAPQDPVASLLIADLDVAQRKPDAALAVLESTLKAHPQLLDARVRQAQILLSQGKVDKAEPAVKEIMRSAPDSAAAQMLNGEILVARKRFDDAVLAFQKAGEKQPNLNAVLAECRALRLGNLPNPIAPLQRWVDQHPNELPSRLLLAQFSQELGDKKAAIKQYETVIQRAPNHAAALNNLAWLQYEAGDKGAVALAKRAHAIAPQDPRITDTYAWLLVESGQVKEGLALLEPIAGRDADAEVRMHYAQALARAGKRDEAREIGEGLATSDSKEVSEEAREFVADLDRG